MSVQITIINSSQLCITCNNDRLANIYVRLEVVIAAQDDIAPAMSSIDYDP